MEGLQAIVRAARAFALMAHAMLTPIVLVSSLVLFLIASTTQSRLVAAAIILLWLASLFVWLLLLHRTRDFARWALAILGVAGLVCLTGAFWMRPSGVSAESNLTQHFSGDARFEPSAISNLVPEIDQLTFGTYIVPGNDPFIGQKEAAHLRAVVQKIYRESASDPSFRSIGSVLGFAYEDILFGTRERLHFYQYVPRQWKKERYPVLIFLHGSLGNFLGYTWVLKRFADETGTMIIAPTYGAGDWEKDRKCQVMREVLSYCTGQSICDNSRIYLGCISNGGRGVSRAIAQLDQKWAGVVWISPIIEEEIVSQPEFRQRAMGVPMLILHGEKDDRVPIEIIEPLGRSMKENGALMDSEYYPGEDHFLLFSKPDASTKRMADWIRRNK